MLKKIISSINGKLSKGTDNISELIEQGIQFHKRNQFNEARVIYSRVIAIDPKNINALQLLATIEGQCKNYQLAISIFDKVLSINEINPIIYNNRGVALREIKRLDEALISLDRAISIKPDYVEAHNNRGNVLTDLLQPLEALKSYNKAIALKPNYTEAYNNKGNALRDLKRLEDALTCYEKAIVLNPEYAEAYNNRGNVLKDLKRIDEALHNYEKSILINPKYAEAYNNRGTALHELKNFEESIKSYNKAIELDQNYSKAYFNRGNVLKDLKVLDDSLINYNKAINLTPDYVEAHWNKALLYILDGKYLEGWELYEWRLKDNAIKKEHYSFPEAKHRWVGDKPIDRKRIFIYSEQGFGDTIQFCRYLPIIKSLGAEIILEVPKNLVSFISSINCVMTVVVKGETLPDFDSYCPMMSLPYALKTTLESIPADIPYLYADKSKVNKWQDKLGKSDSLRIGLVWTGSKIHSNDINRSIPLKLLLPLINLPIELHSLQKEYRNEDIELLLETPEIHQHQDQLNDFSDTAALAQCMDLIISVDTSVAHVSGSIGKPVWILLPFAPDYRWMLDRKDSPWYPTANLFRQYQPGDWNSVIATVQDSLIALIKNTQQIN